MRTDAIEKAKTKSYTDAEAGAQFDKIKADCGAEPTAAMLADYDVDALLKIGVARPLAVLWGEAYGKKGPTKDKKFRADKARGYLASQLAAFVAVDPKGADEDLKKEVNRRTGGEPFRFVVAGKLNEEETAKRIQALFDRDPAAPFVVIAGQKIAPVGWEEAASKEDDEDPYFYGAPLGQPGDVSARLGLSLSKVSHATRQAIRCARSHDLAAAPVPLLQADARMAEGKTPEQYLQAHPLAEMAWPSYAHPSLKIARRPFAETIEPPALGGSSTAGTPGAPRGKAPLMYVLGGEEPAWKSLRDHFSTMIRVGKLEVKTAGLDVRPGQDWAATQAGWLREAAIVLVMLSASTIADEYVETSIQSAKRAGKYVVPVMARFCGLAGTPLDGCKILPNSGKPYAGDSDGVAIAEAVSALLARLPVSR